MSQRGGGRGRASHGRATQKQTSGPSQQERHLPHAQASSSGAVRRPGTQMVIHTRYEIRYKILMYSDMRILFQKWLYSEVNIL